MIRDGFITLTIKFLHFFVSKSLQFRFVSIQESLSSIPSLLFWVAFTRSISSMGNDCLCNATKSLWLINQCQPQELAFESSFSFSYPFASSILLLTRHHICLNMPLTKVDDGFCGQQLCDVANRDLPIGIGLNLII